MEHAGEILALAGRYGTPSEADYARGLLQRRMQLPHADVARAYCHLHDAYRAVRNKRAGESRAMATQAARLFEALGWKHQEQEAHKIAEPSSKEAESRPRPAVLGELRPALSAREVEVAELVLRGLTNRAIANELSISEHTVESHMTSIFNRLGLRSRWQLLDLVK